MNTKKTIVKDISKRINYTSNELKLRVIKIFVRLKFIDFFSLLNIMSKMHHVSSICNLNNKCFVTSRSKGVYYKARLSRIKLKELISNKLLIGFAKYSW